MMSKRFLLLVLILNCTVFGYSQNTNANSLDNMGITLPGRNYEYKHKTEGSPYLNKSFLHAKVSDKISNALMRYNAYDDEFEFINSNNDTLVLNKSASIGTITFTALNTNYQLVDFVDKSGRMNSGYLIKLHEKNELVLYKRQKVNYYEAKAATSSYERNSPARFSPAKDSFFLKNKEGVLTELPSNKKGLLKLFPEKKAVVEAFIKQNDIDFDKELDWIKLIDFLAS